MFEAQERSGPQGGGSPDLAGLEAVAPGAELAALLTRVDPTQVSDAYNLVEIAAACERLKAWADAIEVHTAAELAAHPACHAEEAVRHGFNPIRAAGQLLAPRLGQSPTTACNRVATAVQLTEELGDTIAALGKGEIDYPKAAALALGVRALDPPDGCCDAVTGEPITPDGIRAGLVARVQARVLPKAGVRSLAQHREAIARAVASVAPKTAEQRHQHACEQRRVEFRSEADGMAWLNVYGPALDLTAVKVMLDAAAEAAKTANPDDPRSLDQIRVDTLGALAWTILENGHLPDTDTEDDHAEDGDGGGDPAGANRHDDDGDLTAADDECAGDASGGVADGSASDDADPDTNDADWPVASDDSDADPDDTDGACCGCGRSSGGAGANNHGLGAGDRPERRRAERARRRGQRLVHRNGRAAAVNVTVPITTLLGLDDAPAELDGYGPITAETARRFAGHGTWRRLLTDPATGALLDYGATRYAPPADLVEHVHARDRSCRFPTCARPARLCQFDHTIPAGTPGWSTSAGNGGPLSAGCHNAKTHAGWRLDQPEPGRFLWTAPTGHRYHVAPAVVGPIIRAAEPEQPIDDLEPEWASDPPPY